MTQDYIDKMLYMVIGQCLKEERLARHLSLRKLSELTGWKMDKSTLQRYEVGSFRIPKESIMDICDAMSIDFDEFMMRASKRFKQTISQTENWLNTEHTVVHGTDLHLTKVITAYQNAPPHIQKAIDSLLQIE